MNARDELHDLGRVWFRGLLSADAISELSASVDLGDRPGARLADGAGLGRHIGPGSEVAAAVDVLGLDPLPVRLVAFNKSEAANWSVPWHQDRVIAVAERKAVGGYANWVQKVGFWHCEPPTRLLREMVFLRTHVDANTERNGPLVLARRSHLVGAVSAREASAVAARCEQEVCCARPGDVLAVHALTLHRSGSAAVPSARRALRVDYARRDQLAPELEWAIGAGIGRRGSAAATGRTVRLG